MKAMYLKSQFVNRKAQNTGLEEVSAPSLCLKAGSALPKLSKMDVCLIFSSISPEVEV